MEKSERIFPALAAIMREARAIGKESQNRQQGFNFRGIDAVMNHLHPLFAKHGVVILPRVTSERAEERQTKAGGNLIYRILTIDYAFFAEDGSCATVTVVGEGMDSGDKAANKAMAVGLKYALTQMLLLPYDEVDPDSETPPETTPRRTTPKRTPPPERKRVERPREEPPEDFMAEEPPAGDLAFEVWDMILCANGGNEEMAASELEEITSFPGRDGRVAGASSEDELRKFSDKRLRVAAEKVRKALDMRNR